MKATVNAVTDKTGCNGTVERTRHACVEDLPKRYFGCDRSTILLPLDPALSGKKK